MPMDRRVTPNLLLQAWPLPDIEAAWDAEVLKRIGEYERGEDVFSPAADVFAEARCLMQRRRYLQANQANA